MTIEIIAKYIQSLLPISHEKAISICDEFEQITFAKNEFIFKENTISQYTYFLASGFVRSYILDNEGNEVTTNIYEAPRFVNDFLSFFKKEKSKENFQAITNCTMWQLSYNQVQTLFHAVPEFREFGRMMLITNYTTLNNRMIAMIKDSSETRYSRLLQEHPEIIMNVPLKIIASYLGITDTSLSRIRKEISKK